MTTYTSRYPLAHNNTYVKTTSIYSSSFYGWYATNPAKSLIGTSVDNQWYSTPGQPTNQKINIDLGEAFVIKRMYFENAHNSGVATQYGIKDVLVYGTNSATAFANTDYSITTDLTLIGTVQVAQHVASNVSDPQYFLLTNTVAYRYIVLRIANNWSSEYMGLRRVECQTEDVILLRVSLDQPYALQGNFVRAFIEQPYSLMVRLDQLFDQVYGLKMIASLVQFYGDQPVLKSVLNQYYQSAFPVVRRLDQVFFDALQIYTVNEELYALSAIIVKPLYQPYHISSGVVKALSEALYRLNSHTIVGNEVAQGYNIFSSGKTITDTSSITIGGVSVRVVRADFRFSQSAYVARGSIILADYEVWQGVAENAPVVITVNGESFNFIVIGKIKAETFDGLSLQIDITSPAVLLSFPYASEVVNNTPINGKMSEIVNNLAALEGLSIVWGIPVDDVLTVNEVQSEGKAPIEVIREIVNDLGGVIQSYPDGSIHAVPRYVVDSDKYETSTTAKVFTTGEDFISLSEDFEKRDGFNKYLVSNVSVSNGWTLEAEKINSYSYKLKAYQTPWSSIVPILSTSELTNVVISPIQGPVIEPLEEEIEIVEGTGTVAKPCYGVISTDYKTSLNLGVISIEENRVVTTGAVGNTLVIVKYNTKYWSWVVTDHDKENVQFILEA